MRNISPIIQFYRRVHPILSEVGSAFFSILFSCGIRNGIEISFEYLQQTMDNNLLLSGHTAEVLAVAYNNSSTILASAGVDKTILLWSVNQSYDNKTVLKSHTNAITALCWTYTDRLIAGSADKSVSNWDIENEKIIRKYKGHSCIVHDVSTPRKTLQIIASVGDDGVAKVWEQRSKKQIRTFQAKYPLTSACFSYNGDKLYVGGIDNQIKVFNIAEDQLEEQIIGHQDTVSCLQISYDGTYLMSNSFDETIKIWDVRPSVAPGKRLTKALCGHIQGNQKGLIRGGWSKDGLYICCGSIDKCVYIWDTTTRKIVQKLGGHLGTVNQVVMGGKNCMASCSNDKNLIVSELPDIFL